MPVTDGSELNCGRGALVTCRDDFRSISMRTSMSCVTLLRTAQGWTKSSLTARTKISDSGTWASNRPSPSDCNGPLALQYEKPKSEVWTHTLISALAIMPVSNEKSSPLTTNSGGGGVGSGACDAGPPVLPPGPSEPPLLQAAISRQHDNPAVAGNKRASGCFMVRTPVPVRGTLAATVTGRRRQDCQLPDTNVVIGFRS